MVKISKAIPQNYLRIQDEYNKLYGCLDDSKLIPHTDKISQNTFEQLILSAIEKANKKSSREILAISPDATTYEIEQICDKRVKHYLRISRSIAAILQLLLTKFLIKTVER
ncbi:MAG: hypothetical protein HC877_08820 [Thioploca sp.]|nr:hypothetical protein [Thioploca sp.]